MAGHSKWANIRFRKGVQDAKRGKIFTKLIREITVASRAGGADETANARLRDAISKALKANMKRDTIDNAIKRGAAGGADAANMLEMRYEGYGPGGIAILVDCLSDNKNRTVSEVRHAFTKYGGNLGTDGSVAYLFRKQGIIILALGQSEELAIELAIENEAKDVSIEGEQVVIHTTAETYNPILSALEQAGLLVDESYLSMQAQTTVIMNDKETAESLIKLIDTLEDLDDVQEVYSNAEYSESLLAMVT